MLEKVIGVVHYALFPEMGSGAGNVLATIEPILRDEFFGAIEITWIKDDRARRQVAETLDDAGIQVMFSGGPPLLSSGLSLSSIDRIERQNAVELAKRLIDMACEVKARNLLIPSGPDPGDALRQAALVAFNRSMEEICSYAVTLRPQDPPVICLEPFDRNIQWRQLLGPTSLAASAIAETRKQFANCGITLDMSHVAQLGENLVDAIRDAGDCLVHAHIANCVLATSDALFGDMHPPFDLANGEYVPEDMVRFLHALEDSGFYCRPCPYGKPVVSLEVRPLQGQDPWQVLAIHKAQLSFGIEHSLKMERER